MERSIKKGQRGTSCISNIWHMQTIIEAIRLWKTHGGLWQKCVSERHGAQTEHFVEGCQSNRTKENDEATSIMLTYHSKRQKRTMRSFKNKTSNARVAYQEGTVLITFERRKKTRFTWLWSQKSLMMNSLFKNQHHSYCLTHLCRPKFMLTWARLEQRPSGAYMLS